jgi:hypothetical protein
MRFPSLLVVRQKFADRALPDVAAEVRSQLAGSGFDARLAPGARVAIGVGSRGITNIAVIVRAAVDWWKAAGFAPFLFPAMGSHGAATAAGQAGVLAHYGITEAAMGCPVLSQLEVVPLGKTVQGIEVFMDRLAAQSDGIMLVGRVKWHTDFAGRIESGLCKMMAIGLGKFAGAQNYHTWSKRLGLEQVVLSVGRRVLESGKILGGLAILEDANHHTARVEAVPAEKIEAREPELLAMVKSWAGRIPCDLDMLIVDEMGKNISGTGIDTRIVNRNISGHYNPWPDTPQIRRIFVRELSDFSYGNAVGIGMADVVTDRLVAKVDWNATRINVLTAGNPAGGRTPLHFATDRECIEAIAPSVGRLDTREITIGWIRNTLELSTLALSENLRAQIDTDPALEIVSGPVEVPFQPDGNLADLLVSAGAGAAGR